jgi:hypothetical protein
MEARIIFQDSDDKVLNLCSLPDSVDLDIIKKEISNYVGNRLPFYKETKRSLFIEEEFAEYITSKASGGFEIGKGNCAMDVKTKNNEGIDVMCVIMNEEISNEKSLIQNFQSSGSNLDQLFAEEKAQEIVHLFMTDFQNKIDKVKKTKNLHDLFIMAYISTLTDIYIACFRFDPEKIPNVSSGGFISSRKKKKDNHYHPYKNTYKNIILNHIIDPAIGKITAYKSKKRVELRLKKGLLHRDFFVEKVFSLPPAT